MKSIRSYSRAKRREMRDKLSRSRRKKFRRAWRELMAEFDRIETKINNGWKE